MQQSYHLKSLSVTSLNAAELLQLTASTVDSVADFTKTNSKELLLAGQLTKLRGSLTKYQKAQQGQVKTATASQLDLADRERDQALTTLTAFVKANAYIKTETVKQAYKKLTELLKGYKNVSKKSYEEETAQLKSLLNKLKSSDYQAAVTALGLSQHVTRLEAAQTNFEQVYNDRIKEQSKATPGQIRTLRRDLEKTYGVVVDLIALHSYCQPEHTAYADLLKTINTLRSRY